MKNKKHINESRKDWGGYYSDNSMGTLSWNPSTPEDCMTAARKNGEIFKETIGLIHPMTKLQIHIQVKKGTQDMMSQKWTNKHIHNVNKNYKKHLMLTIKN